MSTTTFFRSIGHFFKLVWPQVVKLEPKLIATAEAIGAGHFIARPLEAQSLVTSIVGDIVDVVKTHGDTGVTLGPDIIAKVRQLIALIEAHPEAPGSTAKPAAP